jgi:hypothetical protein
MKGDSWLILELVVILAAFGLVSFWFTPVYGVGVTFVTAIFADALKVLLGYKFGRSMPSQAGDVREGQASTSTTTVETVSPDPANPKPDA